MSTQLHPLDPLTANEVTQTSTLVKQHEKDRTIHFKHIAIIEPRKTLLREYLFEERAGTKDVSNLPRRASALYYHRGTADLFLAFVNLSDGKVERSEQLDSRFHAQADVDEIIMMRDICLSHPKVLEAFEKFKLPAGSILVADTWPYGRDTAGPESRKVQCYMFARTPSSGGHEGSNHYDTPLNFSPFFDMTTHELLDLVYLPTGADSTLKPDAKYVPHETREYHQDLQSNPPRSDLKPLYIRQPEGPSYNINGHLITWQKWRFRVGFNWREGMILHDVTYDGRELFHRLSLSEMFVPYGDPRSPYSRKSVFDVGDIGAGVAANNLKLGCDCLGLIKYFSFIISDSNGNPVERPNAICMHEIDDGIGWKHTNSRYGVVSITRSRVLVLQSIITVGNYEYIFLWHFDQAAGLHYKIQATGILSTAPIDPGIQVPWGTNVNTGVMAPFHQHVFCLRIDPSIDGSNNTFIEEDSHAMPVTDLNSYGVGYTTSQTALTTSSHSSSLPNRTHKIVNPSIINPVSGHPVAYAIHSPTKQMLLAQPDSWHGKRARYAYHPFWVTKYQDGELYAAGEYTYQSLPDPINRSTTPVPISNSSATSERGGDLANWAARKDPTENEDIVIWHSISLTHNPRPEDYPVMPCDTLTISFKPSGFFTCNPALDVPQSLQGRNQSIEVEDFQAAGSGKEKL